ncbi:hypothetical protein GCM10010112_30120 [Actinoplanes lobatus]|uniref:Aldehyde dehydrogenase domain-containing protein n=1 Tax=Actinoplanes lobatus TaxID=113568 RepID=A0ABQ4AA60_9ACTN|nr:hypothetical protein GCM10010112_30120 [Actinoplanes lobatus]GIE37364.1 hypothetical protein Alo02nite_02620 [Actinoplanes lobatus]
MALADPDLAGIHFTGSTATFRHLWRTVGENVDRYRTYPRLVGETGGKDFVLAHPSADVDALHTALLGRTSIRARSARRRPGRTCRGACGRAACGIGSRPRSLPSGTATSPTFRCSVAR